MREEKDGEGTEGVWMGKFQARGARGEGRAGLECSVGCDRGREGSTANFLGGRGTQRARARWRDSSEALRALAPVRRTGSSL